MKALTNIKSYLLMLLIIPAAGFSQSGHFHQAYGISAFRYFTDSSYDAAAIAITYEPRLNIFEFGDNNSLGMVSSFSLGMVEWREGTKMMLDLPLMAAYNHGWASTWTSDKDMGYEVAAGMDYHSSAISSGNTFQIFSPIISLKIRMLKFVVINVTYTQAATKEKSVFSIKFMRQIRNNLY